MFTNVAARPSSRSAFAISALVVFVLALLVPFAFQPPQVQAAPLFSAVAVSDSGTGNSLADPNSSTMVAVSRDGIIYVAYRGSNGVRVARSITNGQSFQPSVQITATNAPVSIAVGTDNVVHVGYVSSNTIWYSRSTDNGATFSTPVLIASVTATAVSIAVDAPYVYLASNRGMQVYVNDASGVGTFVERSTGLAQRAFSGLLVDPASGDLFVIGDSPALSYTVSSDNGATFATPVNPAGTVYYSTYIGGFGFIGRKVYVAGGQLVAGSGTAAVLIDLDTGTSVARTFNNNTVSSSRTLAVDGEGNVVDGYSNGGNVFFAVSTDQGATFGTPTTIATGSTRMELALNPTTNSVLAAYEQGGQIFMSVYGGVLPPPPDPPTISDIADQTTAENTPVGPIAFTVDDPGGDPAGITLRATSSNPSVVANAGITFGGSGANRTVTITPVTDAIGSTTITVTAIDSDNRTAIDSFVVTVNAIVQDQTITFDPLPNRTYGDADFTVSAAASSGLAVSFSSTTTAVCTVSGTTVTLVAAGTCTIAADQAGDASYNPAPQVTQSFEVAKAELTITAEDKTRKVNTANPVFTFTANGFVGSDTINDIDTLPTLATTATLASPVGSYAIEVTGGSDNNYTLVGVSGTLNVVLKDVPLISWPEPAAIVYGTALSATHLNATASFNATTVAGTFSYNPPLGTVLNAGNDQVLDVTFTPADTDVYATVSASVTIDVTKAELTITAEDKTRKVNTANPVLTFTANGFVGSDTINDIDTLPTLATTATLASPVGSYAIEVTGGNDNNYTLVGVSGTLNVVLQDVPLISWPEPTTIVYGMALSTTQLNATASFNATTVAGTFSYTPPLGTVLNAGDNQVLNVTFTPADTAAYATVSALVTIDVSRAPLTVTANDQARRVGLPNPQLTFTVQGLVNGDTIATALTGALTTTAQESSAPGAYPITRGTLEATNYAIAFTPGVLTVRPYMLYVPVFIGRAADVVPSP
jgi:MBG domain (YGX type)